MREEAIQHAVLRILNQWDSMQEHTKLEDALKYSIGLGQGFTLGRPGQKDFGDYWYAWFNANLTMKLLVGRGDGLRTEKILKKEVMNIARQIWTKEKQGQLSLFD